MYKYLLAGVALLCTVQSVCQEVDLFKQQDEESLQADKKRTDYAIATFKTTRLINGHTVENLGKRVLDVKISHRFETLNSGLYELFGLDNARMRMGLDYGITDRLMVGFGRTTFQKQYDGFFKYKILRQSSGYKSMPVTVSAVAAIMVATDRDALRSKYNIDPALNIRFSDKLFYTYQLLIGRKFNDNTSLQIMPTLVHHNLVEKTTDKNDMFALGIGGRQKLSKRLSLNAEYYYVLPAHKLPGTYNSASVGLDIETGGHVFQLHFTNSRGMTEKSFITETEGRWSKGDIHFGFNIARVFTIGGKKSKS